MFAPCIPHSVDDYSYLLCSQHIDKIIIFFVHLNDTNTLIKILNINRISIEMGNVFPLYKLPIYTVIQYFISKYNFLDVYLFNFGSKRLYCTTILAIRKITFQKMLSKMPIFTSKNEKFRPFFKF